MKDLIAVAVIIVILSLASGYIIKAKKSGKKCIGCPDGCSGCQNCPSKDSSDRKSN